MSLGQAFGVINEGREGCYFPEIAYVTQGDKVFFAKGDYKASGPLVESIGQSHTIVESIDDLETEDIVVEGKQVKRVKDGVWTVEGPFQRSGVRNANGRVYSKKIWERLVGDAKSIPMQTMQAGGMIGHLEHPSDGRTDGKEGAIVVRDLKLQDDGVVWGKAEILDTPNGLILQEYTRKGVRWGVSSRGNGSVNDDGNVNEDDYVVETWDAVMRPSTPGAYPTVVSGPKKNESTQGVNESVDIDTMSKNASKKRDEEAVQLFTAQVDYLLDTNPDALSETDRKVLHSALTEKLNQLAVMRSKGALSEEASTVLHARLTEGKTAAEQTNDPQEVFESVVDSVLTEEDANKAKDDAVRHIVESLRLKVDEANADVELERGRAESAEAELAQLRKTLAEKSSELAEKESRVDALESRLEAQKEEFEAKLAEQRITLEGEFAEERTELVEKLELLQSLLAENSTKNTTDSVKETVVEILRETPELKPFETTLETAVSADHAKSLAESLLPAAMRQSREERTQQVSAADIKRTALPRGNVVSESTKADQRPTKPTSKGATLAGQALHRITE
jgi:hypothetical protein